MHIKLILVSELWPLVGTQSKVSLRRLWSAPGALDQGLFRESEFSMMIVLMLTINTALFVTTENATRQAKIFRASRL